MGLATVVSTRREATNVTVCGFDTCVMLVPSILTSTLTSPAVVDFNDAVREVPAPANAVSVAVAEPVPLRAVVRPAPVKVVVGLRYTSFRLTVIVDASVPSARTFVVGLAATVV